MIEDRTGEGQKDFASEALLSSLTLKESRCFPLRSDVLSLDILLHITPQDFVLCKVCLYLFIKLR